MIPLSVLRSYSPHPDKLDLTGLTQDEITHGIKSSKLPDYIRYKQYLTDTNEAVAQLAEMIIQFAVNLSLDPDQTLDWARKLQQALPQSEFDSWVATLLDGGPSIFMNTLSELQTTYPNGAAGVALVRETDPAKIYVWNGSSWEDFGDYQGIEIKDNSVTTTKIADNAVLPIKISDYTNGRNMLSKHAGLTWVVGLLEGGVIKSTGTSYKTNLDFISVDPNKDYFLSFGRPDGRGDGGYSFYDVNGNHISTHYIAANFKDGLKITPPANARLIRFSIKDTTTWYQFEEGDTPTAYTNEYRLSDLYVGAEDVDNLINLLDFERPKNLLKSQDVNWEIGVLSMSGGVDTGGVTYQTSNMIDIRNEQGYVTFSSNDYGVVVFYDLAGSFVKFNLVSNAHLKPDGSFKATFPIPPEAHNMRVSVRIGSRYQVEYGSVQTQYSEETRYSLSGVNTGATEEYVDDKVNQILHVPTPFNHDAELAMFTAYGQSWAQGYDTDAYSTEQIYDNLMFNTGIVNNPLESEVTPSSLIPLVERNGVHNWESGYGQKLGETPVSGQTNMVKQLLSEENKATTTNVKYQFIGNSPGRGSLSIDGLSKGTVWYNRLITQVQQAFDLAQAQGKTFKMLAFSWTQGGNEYVADYGAKLEKIRADIEAEVKAITGQNEPVKCITWQPFSGMENGTAKRLYDEFVKPSETYEHIVNAGATYQLDPLSKTNVHLTSQSSAHLGAYYGLAYKRTINDGVKFEPLKPVKITTQRQIALLEFNNTTPLKFDTESLVQAENYGFKILKADGTQIPITNVEIASFNTIKIIREVGWFDTTDRIIYGDTGLGYGGTDKKRGNLRDTSDSVYKYKDLSLPLYDWCVVFDLTVSELK